MKPTLVLADDHKIILDGLCSLLAADGRQLVELAKSLQISMPLLNGIEAVRQLRESGSTAKVVFLTMHPDASYLLRAIQAGALGYILKHAASEELTHAIRHALQNRLYVSPGLRTPAMEEMLDERKVHLRGSLN